MILLACWALAAGLTLAWPPASRQRAGDPRLAGYPWLFQRGGRPPAAGEALVEVVAVGDMMLGRGVPDALAATEAGMDPAGANPLFRSLARVAPWLRAADLALGNLECTLGEAGSARPGAYRLRAPATAAGALQAAGLDILGLANNHALDYGHQGLAASLALLSEAGVDAIGVPCEPTAGASHLAAGAVPLIHQVRGLRLAFLAYNAVPDPDSPIPCTGLGPASGGTPTFEAFLAAVSAARQTADAVIVSVHWGYEYDPRPDPRQEDMAAALLAAGADLVVGHHPHVVQGTALALALDGRTGLVAYSLGNLVFDQEQGDTRQGLALRAFFDQDGLRAVQALPLRAGPRPRLLAPAEAGDLLARVAANGQVGKWANGQVRLAVREGPRDLAMAGREADFELQVVTENQLPAENTTFDSGQIDLTGDGQPEEVRLEEGQVVVYQAGVETWRGLPAWRVVDLALGDPNDDGRAEMLLALYKPDAEGVPRSQPFVVGYRQGSYRVLWGGSPVARPIHEVELGDLDGDGRQELVVLEEAEAGQRAVTVWRWHGWGFGQLWRSAPGPYCRLALQPDPTGSLPLVIGVTTPAPGRPAPARQAPPARAVGPRRGPGSWPAANPGSVVPGP